MVNTPHFDYPFRFSHNSVVTIEQDSDKDLENCVFAALSTEIGTRYYVPNFGIDDPTFDNAPLDLPTMVQQIRNSEPRADAVITQEILDQYLTVKLTVGVSSVGT